MAKVFVGRVKFYIENNLLLLLSDYIEKQTRSYDSSNRSSRLYW
jgi:hypothetical protein